MPAARRSTRAERQADTRAALLRSASQLICELGLQGASVDRIAEHAGYTKGAFYANFDSKEHLFLVVLEEKFAAELERLQAAMPGTREPAAEAREASEQFLAYVDRDPQWPRLYQEFAAHAARNDAFRVELLARQRALRERLAELYAGWAGAYGLKPTLDPGEVAAMTFFMADGFLLSRIIDPELGVDLYVTMVELFLRGLIGTASA